MGPACRVPRRLGAGRFEPGTAATDRGGRRPARARSGVLSREGPGPRPERRAAEVCLVWIRMTVSAGSRCLSLTASAGPAAERRRTEPVPEAGRRCRRVLPRRPPRSPRACPRGAPPQAGSARSRGWRRGGCRGASAAGSVIVPVEDMCSSPVVRVPGSGLAAPTLATGMLFGTSLSPGRTIPWAVADRPSSEASAATGTTSGSARPTYAYCSGPRATGRASSPHAQGRRRSGPVHRGPPRPARARPLPPLEVATRPAFMIHGDGQRQTRRYGRSGT